MDFSVGRDISVARKMGRELSNDNAHYVGHHFFLDCAFIVVLNADVAP